MSEQIKEQSSELDPKAFKRLVITRFFLAFIALGLMFFLSAWTFNYWQAWVYIVVLIVPIVFIIRYLYKRDPELLKRRLRMRERQKTQKLLQAAFPVFLLPLIIPGFDHRLGWSNVPLFVIIISDLLVLAGYSFIGLVFRTNSYASRIIEVEKGQKVITTGPYSVVRHPMYLGVLIFYIFSPLALGSYWAVIPALLVIPILVVRIRGEEKELLENLEGYKEYVTKTRHRLIPGIW
ncbi:MAG: isoprenylcysteine carboxylmethyltransferase family protein [Chloroflexota bacterium]